MKFVIVGLGNIGKTHQQSLKSLGHKVIPCHRNDNLKKILKENKPDGVLVCNLNNLHTIAGLTAIKAGYPVFMEKPLADKIEGVKQLIDLAERKKLILQMGYVLRFEQGLKKIKQSLDKNLAGKIYSARIEVGSYLPNWHPHLDYRKRYNARKDLGGGVIGDLSHEIDYAYWFFGKVKKVMGMVKHIPELKIETESLAAILMEHRSGVISEIHLDYLQKEYSRNLKIIGSEKNLYWQYQKSNPEKTKIKFHDQMKNFIKAIKGKEKPKITGKDGLHVLKIIEAIKKSNKLGKMITI